MRPLRRKKTFEVTYDPDTGQDRVWRVEQSQDGLSREGSVDSGEILRKFFKDCGCDAEIGGRCYVCGAVSCQACHGRCRSCQKPICLEHSHFHVLEDQNEHRLCGSCYDVIRRKEKWTKVRKSISSFFVEEQHDE